MSTGEPDATEIGHVRFGGGSSEKDHVNWHLVGALPYCPSGSDRRSPEKDPDHGHLAGGLPVFKVGVCTPGHRAWTRTSEVLEFRTFYGVLRTMAADLRKRGVTHVVMEASGVYTCGRAGSG